MVQKNALSSTVALAVVGVAVLVAGLLMLRAAIRARVAYRKARRTRRRIVGKVIGNKAEEEDTWCPVVEYHDPRTGKRFTFSPPLYASTKLAEGREVAVLWDERGREPILDVWPFRAGFAGNILFLILAVTCTVCGVLAIYAVI